MKKIVLTTLAVVGLAALASAQGTVQWTGVANALIAQTNGTVFSSFEAAGTANQLTGGPGNTLGSGATQYYYELLVSSSSSTAPTTTAGLAAWSDTSLEAENGAAANGRITQLNPSTDNVANNWAAGTSENVILVGWSANLGTTWSTVLNELQNWGADQIANAYFGVSSVGTLTSGTANPGVIVFGANAGQINNAAGSPEQLDLLGTVPEPGTMALAAIGGASLLLFRRKK